MKLLFKQRMFSWFDSYDIYDEGGNPYFVVKGQLSWGHLFQIYDRNGRNIGTLKQQIFTFLPRFTMYENGYVVGQIEREFSPFSPRFHLDCSSWIVTGDWVQWNYQIVDNGRLVASINKQLFNWTDTYVLTISDERDALRVLMIVLAIDAIKCSQSRTSD